MKRRTQSLLVDVVISAASIALSVYMFLETRETDRLSNADVRSTCEVLSFGVTDSASEPGAGGNATYHSPFVELAHTVDGERYTRVDSGMNYKSSMSANELVRDMRVGQLLECRYVAGSPGDVVYFHQTETSIAAGYGFAAFLLVIPLMVLTSRRRRREA